MWNDCISKFLFFKYFDIHLITEDAESKIHLIFSMYDIQRRGRLSKKDFANMIKWELRFKSFWMVVCLNYVPFYTIDQNE